MAAVVEAEGLEEVAGHSLRLANSVCGRKLSSMGAYRFPVITGLVLALLIGLAGFTGYGVMLFYCWLPILFLIVVLAARTLKSQKPIAGFVSAVLIMLALSTAGAFSGHWVRRLHSRSKYKSCEPILELLQEYRAEHGRFPAKLIEVQGFTLAQRKSGLRIAQGKFLETGIDLGEINSHDALIYLDPQIMSCVVPVTKLLPLSFTRLYVYGWSSDSPSWKYQKLVWSLSISHK